MWKSNLFFSHFQIYKLLLWSKMHACSFFSYALKFAIKPLDLDLSWDLMIIYLPFEFKSSHWHGFLRPSSQNRWTITKVSFRELRYACLFLVLKLGMTHFVSLIKSLKFLSSVCPKICNWHLLFHGHIRAYCWELEQDFFSSIFAVTEDLLMPDFKQNCMTLKYLRNSRAFQKRNYYGTYRILEQNDQNC